jgi:hypothetical protein
MRPDRLASDHIATRRTRHEVPCLVGKKSCVLLFHRAMPVRIRQGVADRGGNRRDLRLSLGGEESRGLRSHPPSHHGMNMARVPMDDWRVVHSRLDSRASRRRQLRRRLRCRWWWRLRCRSQRPQVRRRCWHQTTPAHLHQLSVARRRRRRHWGHTWRSRRHRGRAWYDRRSWGRAWHDSRHWGHAWCSRDHRKRCRCTRKTCREMTDRRRWLNHRVRRKQGLQLGVRGRCRGGGVVEIRLVKHNNVGR